MSGNADQAYLPSPVSVEQLVVEITAAMWRVLYRTRPTLHHDLPALKGKPAVSYGEVELLTAHCCLVFASDGCLQDAGKTEDTTEALIARIKAERHAKQAAAAN